MAYLIVPVIAVAFAAVCVYLRFAPSRAGLLARVQVKLPLYIWVLNIFMLFINTVFLFSHSHGAP